MNPAMSRLVSQVGRARRTCHPPSLLYQLNNSQFGPASTPHRRASRKYVPRHPDVYRSSARTTTRSVTDEEIAIRKADADALPGVLVGFMRRSTPALEPLIQHQVWVLLKAFMTFAMDPTTFRPRPLDPSGFQELMRAMESSGITLRHARTLYSILNYYRKHKAVNKLEIGRGSIIFDLSLMLGRYMVAMGDPEMTAGRLSYVLRRVESRDTADRVFDREGILAARRTLRQTESLPERKSWLRDAREDMLAARHTLHQLIKNSNGELFELVVLEAKILAAMGQDKAAIALFESAVPAAQRAAQEGRPTELRRNEFPLRRSRDESQEQDPFGLMAPWDDLIDLCHDSLSHEQRLRYVEIGVAADGALAHFYAAKWAAADYTRRQMSDEAIDDGVSKYTRPARELEDIGRPSAWLYYMTRSAASGMPDAAAEVGKFYWQTRWRFLDDEPSDETKPTPMDKWPSTSSLGRFARRLLRAIGVSAAKPAPEDVFHTVALPYTPEQRVKYASEWLIQAARQGYAPALRTLIEIESTKQIYRDNATDAAAIDMTSLRYLYKDKREWVDALFTGDKVAQRPDTIANPLLLENDAYFHVTHLHAALAARDYWQKLTKTSMPSPHEILGRLMKGMEALGHDSKDCIEILHWLGPQDVLALWQDDETYDQLYAFAKNVCDENQWDVYWPSRKLLYSAQDRT